MKKWILAASVLIAISTLTASTVDDLYKSTMASPPFRMEIIGMTSGKKFSSLIFDTIPGVNYSVFASEDLINWSPLGSQYYGLGEHVIIPVIETPAESGSTGSYEPAVENAVTVPLLMRTVAGGGLLLSFISLGDGHPVNFSVPDLTIPSAWENIPIFVPPSTDGYNFVIFHLGSVAASVDSDPLSDGDQAMIDVFKNHFADFSASVENTVQNSSLVAPIPAVSADHRFFKVIADSAFDSDGDGIPDWLEIAQLAASAGGGSGSPLSNPFNGDANGDGIPDSEQLDSDGDGIMDSRDASLGNRDVAWQSNDPMLFSAFPLESSELPYQINDQGIILFHDSIWKNGQFHSLNSSGPESLSNCHPYALSDNGIVLGYGSIDLPGDSVQASCLCQVAWPVDGGDPFVLKDGGNYLVPDPSVQITQPSEMGIDANGRFVAYSAAPVFDIFQGVYAKGLKIGAGAPRRIFKITSAGVVASESGDPGDNIWIADDGTFCGRTTQGKFAVGGHEFDDFYKKAASLPSGELAVLVPPNTGAPPKMKILKDSSWLNTDIIPGVIDVSADGRFLLAHNWKVWENSVFDFAYGSKRMPGASDWTDSTRCEFLDTTRHGWTLASKTLEDGTFNPIALCPIWLTTDTIAQGVDNISAMADNDSDIYSAAEKLGNRPEFWIMVPAGGSKTVKIRSVATAETKLSLSASGATIFQPNELSAAEENVTISTPMTSNGLEIPVVFKIGSQGSVSTPLKIKSMKARVVNIVFWKIKRQASTAVPNLPSDAAIQNYLNGVYGPQINATFNVVVKSSWDTFPASLDPEKPFDVSDPPNSTQLAIAGNKDEGHINVMVLGGYDHFFGAGAPNLTGFTNPGENWSWIPADSLFSTAPRSQEAWLMLSRMK